MNNYLRELTYDKVIYYKKLAFHPVKVKDYLDFENYSGVISIDKNSLGPEEISMKYLDFLFHVTETDSEKPYLLILDRLLSLILIEEESFEKLETSILRYKYDDKNRAIIEINGENYNDKDFKEFRKIIALQNSVPLPDEDISKDVRDSLEKAKQYKNKLSGVKPGSLEDYIVSVSVETGWSMEYILNLSIRKFLKSIDRLDNLIHYKIYLQASMSGMVEFKDKSFIKHWLSNLDVENPYADVSVDLDTVQKTVNLENAVKKH